MLASRRLELHSLLEKNEQKHYSSNDQRSNSMNSNNPAYWALVENRANQLNPNNEEYKGDAEGEKEE